MKWSRQAPGSAVTNRRTRLTGAATESLRRRSPATLPEALLCVSRESTLYLPCTYRSPAHYPRRATKPGAVSLHSAAAVPMSRKKIRTPNGNSFLQQFALHALVCAPESSATVRVLTKAPESRFLGSEARADRGRSEEGQVCGPGSQRPLLGRASRGAGGGVRVGLRIDEDAGCPPRAAITTGIESP